MHVRRDVLRTVEHERGEEDHTEEVRGKEHPQAQRALEACRQDPDRVMLVSLHRDRRAEHDDPDDHHAGDFLGPWDRRLQHVAGEDLGRDQREKPDHQHEEGALALPETAARDIFGRSRGVPVFSPLFAFVAAPCWCAPASGSVVKSGRAARS